MTNMLVPSDIQELLKPGRVVPLPARILVPPHGRLIWEGKKKAILSSRLTEKYIGIPVYFVEGDKALGIIEIKEPKKISLEEAKKLRNKHMVSDEEIKRWWKGKKILYYYPIELISKFDPPKEIIRPQGAQVWLQTVTFKSLEIPSPSKMTDEELLETHKRLHELWHEADDSKEDIINYHILVKEELRKRKLGHKDIDELDEKSRLFQEKFSKSGYKITFFGTKGLVEEEGPGHRFHTAVLYEFKGKRLLIDYGEKNPGNLKEIKPDYILLSHSHPDHIGGLMDMPVIVSKDTAKEIPELYKDFNIDIRSQFESYKPFRLGPFKITPIPVLHSIRSKMHVFLIEMGDKKVLQATDILGWHKGDREKFVKDLDLAIIDGSSLERTLARKKGKAGEPYGHASIFQQLKNWYLPENTKRVIITHLGKEPLALGDEELLRRVKEITKLPVYIAQDSAVINLSEDLAPIYTSGKVEGRRIYLKEVLPYFKNFIIQRPLAYLTGGLVNQGSTRGDIDILLPDWLSFDMRRIIEFRIARSLPWYLRRRLHFVYDRFSTPFTNAVPLFNLVMVRSKDEILRLSDIEKQLREKPRIAEAVKDAEASAREDKIKLFRYFLPLKPTRGYYPGKRQTIDLFIEVMEASGTYPFYSTKKYDGFNCILMKKGDKIKAYSEDGEVITDRLPTLVEEIKRLTKEDCVLMAELEWWEDNDHKPREVIAGYIHRKETPDDSHVVANVYDMPYFKVDIHNEPFEKRLKLLESLPFKQRTWKIPNIKIKLNFAPYLLSKNREELRKHTEFLRKLPGSEGNVAKTRDFKYNLKGIRSGMVKFHNSTVVYGKVLKIKETKVKGVYNYYFGIEPGKYKGKVEELENVFYHRIGRTFSTSLKAKVGDVLEIEGETLNVEHNLKDDTWNLSLWAPRVMRKVDRKADTIKEAIERARKNYCLQEKEITEDGEIIYLSDIEKLNLKQFRATGMDEDLKHPKERKKELIADLRYLGNSAFPRLKQGLKWGDWKMIDVLKYFGIGVDIKPKKKSGSWYECWKRAEKYMKTRVEKQADPYLEYPKPEEPKEYVVQHHYRGRSVHSDLRIKIDDYLIGWTIMDMIKGKINEPVMNLKQAKKYDAQNIFKIDWEKGVPKLRPGIKPGFKEKYAELAAARKAPEPVEWLNVEGITPPGEVGGTKRYPGVFHIIDKGYCEFGAQKCMNGKTELIVKDEDGYIKKAELRSIVEQRRNVEVLTPLGFQKIRRYFRIPLNPKQYLKIVLENGSSLKCDFQHPSFRFNEGKIEKVPARQLKVGDLIPIFSNGYEGSSGNYELGRFLGLYLAEGSKAFKTNQELSFAFNETEEDLIEFVSNFGKKFGAKVTITKNGRKTGRGISVNLCQAGALNGLVRQFVKTNKQGLRSEVFGLSLEARRGLIDGFHQGDNDDCEKYKYKAIGQGKKHIQLLKDIHKLLFSVGEIASLNIWKGRGGRVTFSLNNYKKGFWHQYWINNQCFIRIKEIEIPKLNGERFLYDIELEDDHRIVLANGIITSNSYFHEYFFSKGKLKGRWFFRQLKPSEFRGKQVEKQEVIPPSRETQFRQEAPWFLIKPIDETPYVISDAAVEKKWIPPYGVSALPEKIKKKIPKEFQYWKEKDETERIRVRDELVKKLGKVLIEKSLSPGARWAKAAYRYVLAQQQLTLWIRSSLEVKKQRVKKALEEFEKLRPFKKEWLKDAIKWLELRPNEIKGLIIEELEVRKSREVDFVLQWHFFRGQKVIRAGVSQQHWDLRLDFPERSGLMHFVLEQNPLKNNEVTAIWKPCKYKEWMNVSQYLPPANERAKMSKEELAKLPPGIEEANPTKETAAYIKILDKGKAIVFEDSDSFKKFEFKGKKLKGLWIFIRENTSDFWIMKRSELPEAK
ncbi:MAG: ATP-dependent DNA ligase [Candidatus Hodarchaeales archaeon]